MRPATRVRIRLLIKGQSRFGFVVVLSPQGVWVLCEGNFEELNTKTNINVYETNTYTNICAGKKSIPQKFLSKNIF